MTTPAGPFTSALLPIPDEEQTMSKDAYRRIIDQVCETCAIPDPESMYEAFDVTVNDAPVTMFYREAIDAVVFYCDFGELPEIDRTNFLQELLIANLFSVEQTTPCFAINPETNHVVLRGQLPVNTLSARDLLATLDAFSASANRWREIGLQAYLDAIELTTYTSTTSRRQAETASVATVTEI